MVTGALRRVTGFSDVQEKGGEIIISGVSAEGLARDMQTIWTTSKVAAAMFTKVTWTNIRIPSFFGLELHYILTKLLSFRKLNTSKRIIKNILEGLQTNTWIANIDRKIEPWLDRNAFKNAFIFKDLLPHQHKFLDRYEEIKPKYGLNGMLLAAAAGSGKAQPLYSKIRTPSGWTTMGEVKVGDVVCTPDGGTANVVGIFPQGIKDIYELTFADGRKTRACGDHLWAFYDASRKDLSAPPVIKTTLEINQRMQTGTRRNHFIPLSQPVKANGRQLPLDPYLLGMLIGDGGLRHQVVFTSPDRQLVDSLVSALPEGCEIRQSTYCEIDYYIRGTEQGSNRMLGHLRDIGLMGKYSYEKFIPEAYMLGNVDQRLALLQGLMDTDGYVDVQSTTSYSTTSKQLAEQVQELVRSLGGLAKISTKTPTYTHKGEKRTGRLAYQVNIRHPQPSCLFRLERKKARCNDNGQYVAHGLKLAIKSIEYVGKEEAQCIMIDHPDHLYITDDYIVTHNTVTSCALALAVHADVVIIVCPKNSVKRVWMKTLNEEFKVPQNPYVAELDGEIQPKKRWHIFHYETLDRALQLAKTVAGKNVVIILDESHNFNDSKSLRTDRFLQLCKVSGAKNIVWASGTPVKAIGFETIPLLKSIDPLFDQRAEEGFRKMYGRDAKRTLDILSYRLGLVTYHVSKDEVMDDKPIIKPVKITMPDGAKYTLANLSKVMDAFIKERTEFYAKNKAQYVKNYNHCVSLYEKTIKTQEQRQELAVYKQTVAWLVKNGFDSRTDGAKAVLTNKFEKEKINPILTPELKKIFKDAKSVVKYVDLKIRGECLGRILTRERVQCHVDMLKYINFKELIGSVSKKTIAFTSYVKVVDACDALLTKQGYKPLKVYGETNNELANIVQKFDKDQSANPLIATFMSLSTAVPLTMANGIIFLNSPWRSYERDQAIARAHRIGQDEPVTVYEIVLDTGKEANISSRSLDIMQWSKDQVDKIMGFQGGADVSLECNGFVVPMRLDLNECIEDVLFDPEQTEYVDQLVAAVPQVSTESFHYPSDYLYYR